jgi:hypothetical protein
MKVIPTLWLQEIALGPSPPTWSNFSHWRCIYYALPFEGMQKSKTCFPFVLPQHTRPLGTSDSESFPALDWQRVFPTIFSLKKSVAVVAAGIRHPLNVFFHV